MQTTSQISFPPPTAEEEEAIVDSRLNNDEKALRRVIKKYHAFTSAQPDAEEDAREAFLVELATFELALKKSLLVCQAETRQVEEYERERRKIATEHEKLRGQIDQLKTSLEDAQMLRKRKIEYDALAEKINILPSRDELQNAIDALENDMSAIRAEHEAQDRILHQQRSALHNVVAGLTALRLIGKDPDTSDGVDSPMPAADDREDGEDAGGVASALAPSSLLNPAARPFVPPSRTSTPGDLQRKPGLSMPTPLSSGTPLSRVSSPLPPPANSTSKDNDIEMGEVDEKRGRKKKIREEELEEGEATDGSSELSDPPGD